MAGKRADIGARLLQQPIDRIVAPLQRFLHVEAASGIVLLVCTAAALILANSSASDGYLAIWKTKVGFSFGDFEMKHSLHHWINDGLMAVFFFVIGLEVKRELVIGELRDPKRAALPIAAALGGMIAPAAIYLIMQGGEPGARGWGIPMATDIAFVVGCMAVLGKRVPHSLRVMLLSLAIADDIGAILVIAVGYTDSLNVAALVWGLAGIAAIVVAQRLGVRNIGVYTILGIGIWFGFHESGVHATIAGVIIGLLTPARSHIGQGFLFESVDRVGDFLSGEGWDSSSGRYTGLRYVEQAAKESLSPLERIETSLHPWSSFLIMPVFALANAGVPFSASDFGQPVAIAVMMGLVLGKPIGIFAMSFLSVRLGIGRMPEGVTWGGIVAAGLLAGIGFTMALFIAGLALDGESLDHAKVGILGASGICAVVGMLLMVVLLPKPKES